MSNAENRHIPVEVVRKLRSDARDRCSLKSHLLDPDELDAAMKMDRLHLGYVLNLHHLQYHSEGGGNSEDNLMLVCPNCHSAVHTHPEIYTVSQLRYAKQHWTAMRALIFSVVESDIQETEMRKGLKRIGVSFVLKVFNLRFQLVVPPSFSVGELAQFVENRILRPAIAYAHTAPFPSLIAKARIGQTYLAFESNQNILTNALTIGSIPGITENTLVSMIDIRLVQALMKMNRDEVETVTLKWGSVPRDLDLHFFVSSIEDASHISYRNQGTFDTFPWAKLDRDVQNGFGPETVSFGLLARGKYRIAVHNYSDEAPLAGSGAIVEAKVRQSTKRFTCPASGDGDWWLVFDLDVESGQLSELNRLSATPEIELNEPPGRRSIHLRRPSP